MKNFAAAALLAALGSAGSAAAQTPADRPAVSQDTKWLNSQGLYLLGLKAADGWRATPSGLRYRLVKGDGAGKHPLVSDTVTIHYAGRLIDGTEFDSSIARGEPATFPLGRLIKGWQEGVVMMGIGDSYEFAIPAELAYGLKGKGPIPGGATLLFTVELLGIVEAAQ